VYRYLRRTDEHPTADTSSPWCAATSRHLAGHRVQGAGDAGELRAGREALLRRRLARYDARTDEHYHSRCLGCGVVRDVHATEPAYRPQVRVGDGFRVEGFRVEVVGYCGSCGG
jgi:hypothetical protein